MVAAGLAAGAAVVARGAAEFAAPDDERVFEHAALLEVLEQRADRLIDVGRPGCAGCPSTIGVMVPAAGPDLHEAHAALHEAARHEHAARGFGIAVHVADVLRLLVDVEGVGRLGLHFEGELEGLDARFEHCLAGEVSRCAARSCA